MSGFSWLCGCGVQGESLEGLAKHITNNPDVDHSKHCKGTLVK